MSWRIIQADCVEAMRELPESSVDAIVTDPPYGLEFMGKEWDRLGDVRQPGDATFHKSGAGPFDRATVRYGYDVDPTIMQRWHHRWATEALRVLKPGAHLLAFGGTRTFHRLTCALEDAGFEIRDCLSWLYGSGFPKSLDVSKAIDKAAGAEREVVGSYRVGGNALTPTSEKGGTYGVGVPNAPPGDLDITAPSTEAAQRWQGWGTALKPAWEPIVMARKPLVGNVAANVQAHGTGALNIDGTRIDARPRKTGTHPGSAVPTGSGTTLTGSSRDRQAEWDMQDLGRWPANVVLGHSPDCAPTVEELRRLRRGLLDELKEMEDNAPNPRDGGDFIARRDAYYARKAEFQQRAEEVTQGCAPDCAAALVDEQAGQRSAGAFPGRTAQGPKFSGRTYNGGAIYDGRIEVERHQTDTGAASRFFYCPKADREERDRGLEHRERRMLDNAVSRADQDNAHARRPNMEPAANHHPTVKPVALMAWLCRMVTPSGGTVLDPFTGSGSTGIAALREGFSFIGIEREAEYVEIARDRIMGDAPLFNVGAEVTA